MMTRYLSLSLLAAVLISLIGVGSLINLIYSKWVPQNDEKASFYSALLEHYQTDIDNQVMTVDTLPDVLDASVLPAYDLPLPAELKAVFEAGKPLSLASEHGVYIYLYLPQTEQVLRVYSPEQSEPDSWLNWVFTLVFYSMIAVAILLWLFPLIRSLNRLQVATAAFGQGDFDTRVASKRLSPIADIEVAFNDMAAKIARLLEDNRLLGRAVSHELKTPLARLRLGIDVVADSAPEDSLRYFERIDRDLDEMQALIDALLKYSRLESASVQVKSESVDVAALCQQQVTAFSGYNTSFSLDLAQHLPRLQTDAGHFAMIISNLVANAVHYGKGAVSLSAAVAEDQLVIRVEDNGAGIPEEHRSRVFIPFERLADEKQPAGHGIGLAAVDRLCQLLGIAIQVDDSETLGGARFSLLIPLKSS